MIKSGKYTYGQKIDGEFDICGKYNVSRITAIRVLNDLEKEGLVSRYRGKGTFCIWKSDIEIQLYPNCDLMDAIKSPERNVWLEEISKEIIKADAFISSIMEIHEGDELEELKQVQIVDEVKVAFFVSHILPSNNRKMVRKTIKIKTMLPPSEVQTGLNLLKDQPVILKEIFFYDDEDNVVKYDKYYYRGDCVFITNDNRLKNGEE